MMERNRRGFVASMLVAGLLTGTAAFAQQKGRRGGDPAQMAERRITAMTERLKLSQDQAAKVRPIIEEEGKKMAELRQKYASEEGRPSREGRQEFMKLREETNKRLEEVLTAEQKEEWKKMQEEQRARFGGRKRGEQK